MKKKRERDPKIIEKQDKCDHRFKVLEQFLDDDLDTDKYMMYCERCLKIIVIVLYYKNEEGMFSYDIIE